MTLIHSSRDCRRAAAGSDIAKCVKEFGVRIAAERVCIRSEFDRLSNSLRRNPNTRRIKDESLAHRTVSLAASVTPNPVVW